MAILDRLAGVFRSYLNSNGDWSDGRERRSYGDPDLEQAFDELDQFLSRKNVYAGNSGSERAFSGDGTAWKASPKPVPEELRGCFAELGVEFGASAEQCKAAYWRLLKRHHPDRHNLNENDRKKATEKSAKINSAYERIREWHETGKI